MKTLLGFATLLIFCNSYVFAENFENKYHTIPVHDDVRSLNIDLQFHFQPTPEYIVLQKPQITILENSSGLLGQCLLMQGNYLNLWHDYRAESSQLMSLLDQARSATPDVKGDLLPQIQEIQTQAERKNKNNAQQKRSSCTKTQNFTKA